MCNWRNVCFQYLRSNFSCCFFFYVCDELLNFYYLCFVCLTQSLREIQLHDLTTHLDIFEDHRENDYEEMQHRFQDVQMEFEYPSIQNVA